MPNSTTVTWGSEPLTFQLESSRPEVLRLAKKFFRFWLKSCESCHLKFQIEPVDGRGWSLQAGGVEEFYGEAEEAVKRAELLAVKEYQSVKYDLVTLHGALLTKGEDCLAIAGDYRTGKTTLAVELWQRGWTLQCDDLMLLQPGWGGVMPTPRRVCLRHSSEPFFPPYVWRQMTGSQGAQKTDEGWMFEPREVETRITRSSGRLTGLVILYPQPGRLQTVPSSDAMIELAPYTNLCAQGDQWSAVQKLLPLSEKIRASRLGRCPLAEQADLVESFMGLRIGRNSF